MATSDSINYSLTARQIIAYALGKTNLLAKGQSPPAEMSDDALVELNVMLKEWQRYSQIWRLKEGYLTVVEDQQGYNLNPRPHRIVDMRFRDSNGRDIDMYEMTRQEYYDLPDKSSTGIPTQFYFDPLRSVSVVFTWPVFSDTVSTETLRVTYQRRFEDVDDLANEVDVDQEHLSTVGYNLAARLADSYSLKGPHIDRVVARAQMLEDKMRDFDRPETIRFIPEERYG